MDIPQLIARINERHQTHFILQHRYATGENQGAYALTTPEGERYVLKWNRWPPWLQSVRRAEQIIEKIINSPQLTDKLARKEPDFPGPMPSSR